MTRQGGLASSWRCIRCGGDAVYVQAGLSPAWPLGRCLAEASAFTMAKADYDLTPWAKRGRPPVRPRLVPITRDLQLLAEQLRQRRVSDQRRVHNERHGQRLVDKCPWCQDLREQLLERRTSHAPTE